MVKFQDITFTTADIIKGVTFFLLIGSMWADLKTDKIKHQKDVEFLQYQVNELKACCEVVGIKINKN